MNKNTEKIPAVIYRGEVMYTLLILKEKEKWHAIYVTNLYLPLDIDEDIKSDYSIALRFSRDTLDELMNDVYNYFFN